MADGVHHQIMFSMDPKNGVLPCTNIIFVCQLKSYKLQEKIGRILFLTIALFICAWFVIVFVKLLHFSVPFIRQPTWEIFRQCYGRPIQYGHNGQIWPHDHIWADINRHPVWPRYITNDRFNIIQEGQDGPRKL